MNKTGCAWSILTLSFSIASLLLMRGLYGMLFLAESATAQPFLGFKLDETPAPTAYATVYPHTQVFPFSIQDDQIKYGYWPNSMCEIFEIGGTVILLDSDAPLSDFRVMVERFEFDDRERNIRRAIEPGFASERGDRGWQVGTIDRVPIFVWLVHEPSGGQVSQEVLVTDLKCENTIAIINFVQRHPIQLER